VAVVPIEGKDGMDQEHGWDHRGKSDENNDNSHLKKEKSNENR
jgi:hypothetical protein